MKKLFLSLAIFSAIVSCSDDDAAPEPTIVGTWKIGKSTTFHTTTEQTTTKYPSGCSIENTIDFSESNARIVSYAYKDNQCLENFTSTMKYVYNPKTKQVIFEGSANGSSSTVIALTKTEMVIEEQLDINDDGIPDRTTTYLTRVK